MNRTWMSDLDAYVEHIRYRVLQDAINSATSSYWLRRAETFAAVGNARCYLPASGRREIA